MLGEEMFQVENGGDGANQLDSGNLRNPELECRRDVELGFSLSQSHFIISLVLELRQENGKCLVSHPSSGRVIDIAFRCNSTYCSLQIARPDELTIWN